MIPFESSVLHRSLRVLALAVLAACAGTERSAAPAPDAALVAEESVKPGINDGFLKEGSAEQFAPRFETESREIFARRSAIVAAVGPEPGMAIADIGAGTGLFTRPFAEAVGGTGRVFAVDIAPGFLAMITKRMRDAGRANVTPVLCTAKSAELPDASVDLVFICDTYHHFEYPRNTLASIHRALRPGGQLVVIDFHRIEGESSEWTMNHVRAGEDVFTAEIEAAGFERTERRDDLLEQNYFLRFRRTGD